MRRSQVKTLISQFLASTGITAAKINTITERTAGAGILIGDMLRLPNGGYRSATLAADDVLTTDSAHFQKLDPGGSARNVDLPVATTGMWFLVSNAADAAENLVVRNTGGGATVVTINQNEAAIVAHNGTAWVLVAIWTIAQS